jgi:AraC-like DNA-binding protein
VVTAARTRWTLQQWPAAERFEAWHHLIGRTHLPWQLEPESDAGARPTGTLVERSLDGLTLVDCATGPCSGRRGRAEIRRTEGDYLGVLVVLDGRERVEQGERAVVLGRGEALVWSSSSPIRFAVPGGLRKRTLLVPRGRLTGGSSVRADALTPLTGPVTTLLTDHLRSVARAGDLPAGAAAAAAAAALELLAAALAGPEPDDPSGPRWAQVREHIEENLADPLLRPHHIAAAHSMSVRGLYQLFERRGLTVSGYIRQRRLTRARSDLARLGAATTVAATAHRWGFVDQAAFSRAFRKRYGCPPNAVRLGRI